jgi:hypothetical protein
MRQNPDMGAGRRSSWQLTPWGAILLVAFVVVVVLAIVAPSSGVYAGLAVVIFIWGVLLSSSFPSIRGANRFDRGRVDLGDEAVRERGRDRTYLD